MSPCFSLFVIQEAHALIGPDAESGLNHGRIDVVAQVAMSDSTFVRPSLAILLAMFVEDVLSSQGIWLEGLAQDKQLPKYNGELVGYF